MFGRANDVANVNDWILFAIIGFIVTGAYIIFLATELARDRRWKSFAVICTAGVSFLALLGWAGWSVSAM